MTLPHRKLKSLINDYELLWAISNHCRWPSLSAVGSDFIRFLYLDPLSQGSGRPEGSTLMLSGTRCKPSEPSWLAGFLFNQDGQDWDYFPYRSFFFVRIRISFRVVSPVHYCDFVAVLIHHFRSAKQRCKSARAVDRNIGGRVPQNCCGSLPIKSEHHVVVYGCTPIWGMLGTL